MEGFVSAVVWIKENRSMKGQRTEQMCRIMFERVKLVIVMLQMYALIVPQQDCLQAKASNNTLHLLTGKWAVINRSKNRSQLIKTGKTKWV